MNDLENIDMSDVVGPDRVLPCGCHVINGAICFVVSTKIDTANLFVRPGRFISVDGGATDGERTEN